MTRPPHERGRAELGWISAGWGRVVAPWGRVVATYRVAPPGQHTRPTPPHRPAQPRSVQTLEPQLADLIRLFGRWLLSGGTPALRSPPHTPTWARHKSSLKPSRSKPTPDGPNTGRPCYRCQQPGHWARDYPVGRQPQLKVRLVAADDGDSSGPASDVEHPLGFADAPPHSDCVYTDPDDDDVCNASHVALDRDSTPTIDVPVCSASAPREWFLPVTVGVWTRSCWLTLVPCAHA